VIESLDIVVDIISKNSKVIPVLKSGAVLLDLLGSGPSADIVLKKLKSSSLLQTIGSLDKDTAKLYEKVKDKLKSI
jgi:hypothetical protein